MADTGVPPSSAKAHRHAQKEIEDVEKAKEREFYRYYHHSQRPKSEANYASPVAHTPPMLPHTDLPPVAPDTPFPADDKALTAFAQLGALRLNARRCLISFFDRRNCYILAEATQTLSLQTGQAQLKEDCLCWGTSVLPKQQSICYYTVNLPVDNNSAKLDDYSSVPTLVVDDLALDARFKNYPFVTGPSHSRFYAGVPIRSPSGHSIGTYCVLDDRPRKGISEVELDFLKDMALTVMRHLEMTRATDDHRRGGIMVRSLGYFAEGKSSLEDWWQDPWEQETTTANQAENLSIPRQRRVTISAPEPPRLNLADPFVVQQSDGIDSTNSSLKSQNPVSPSSGAPGSTVVTPASEILSVVHPPVETTTPTTSSTKNDSSKSKVSREVAATFTRAAKMIQEATEADGVVFFDAKVSTFGGLVDDDFLQEGDQMEPEKPCAVLGATQSFFNGQNAMSEAVLRHLLRTYGNHGQIFNFDDDSMWETEAPVDGKGSNVPTPLEETLAFITSTSKRPESSSRSQDDENLLKEVFPKARSLVLYPLWDPHRDRWFASAIIWSSEPMRIFTSDQELSYLAAFSNSIMAEVARLDTKLADAAKGDFISSISHELRSPLHGILGSCELLKDTNIDNFQISMAQTIETCGKTLLDTINHVLDFAKINNLTRGASKKLKKRSQSTKHIISPAQSHTNDIMTLITDVDLSILTEEVLETVFAGYNFQKTATTQMFELPSTKSDIPPIAVIVDINQSDNYVFRTQPGAWRRILMNIFGNALKYTPAGYIKVKLQVTQSSELEDDSTELRLIITDSGIGMSEDYVNNRLFHSFVQENPLSQGTGLGLSIVKQIVESLGGEIEVRSEKDRGTKFTVICPLKLSILSPAPIAKDVDRELATARGRTEGMNVSFVGFDEEGEYFPVKSLKNKNATMLTLKALDNLVTDWFGMRVQKTGSIIVEPPDLFVATESGAKWLRSQYSSQPALATTAPVIVVCQGAASAQTTNATAITVPGQVFECISQPCGPHKLAKALTSCLNRHGNRVTVELTETDSTVLPNVEQLNLKENLTPEATAPQANNPEFSTGLVSPVLEQHRPPMTTALSAPEIRSVNSSPVKKMRGTQRPLHCLCVDDNPINLRLLRTFTEKLGHTYGLATNGREAVSSFVSSSTSLSRRFDVVLMDINMPEMDGLEATRQIRAHERDEGLPPVTIIALTGVASAEAQQEAHVSGVNLFLIKPVRLGELDTVLKGVIVGEEKKEESKKAQSGEEDKAPANNVLENVKPESLCAGEAASLQVGS